MPANDEPAALAPTEFTELTSTEVAPGPGGRVARTSGHVGGALVFVQLWESFGWFGAKDWTTDQAASVMAVAVFLIAAAHNATNWWLTQRTPK